MLSCWKAKISSVYACDGLPFCGFSWDLSQASQPTSPQPPTATMATPSEKACRVLIRHSPSCRPRMPQTVELPILAQQQRHKPHRQSSHRSRRRRRQYPTRRVAALWQVLSPIRVESESAWLYFNLRYASPRPPGSRRHLTHDPRNRRVLGHSLAFGPSPHAGGYYGLG